MELQKKAIIVNFTARCWSARKYDKNVTTKVENIYGASNSGRWNKVLGQLNKIAEINQLINSFRRYHYSMTLPWENNCGLLPSEHIFEYSNKAREYREKFDKLSKEFLGEYPMFKENARAFLNGMFKDSDYPSIHDLEDKFEFTVSLQPVPQVGDFRVNIQNDELVRIKEEYAKLEQETLANGMKKVWQRTFDAIKHIIEKLSEYNPDNKKKSSFRDTLITNVTELVGLLPALNIVNDPKLEEMRRELEQRICTIEPHNLRNDAQLRSDTVEVAKDIMGRMSGFGA